MWSDGSGGGSMYPVRRLQISKEYASLVVIFFSGSKAVESDFLKDMVYLVFHYISSL